MRNCTRGRFLAHVVRRAFDRFRASNGWMRMQCHWPRRYGALSSKGDHYCDEKEKASDAWAGLRSVCGGGAGGCGGGDWAAGGVDGVEGGDGGGGYWGGGWRVCVGGGGGGGAGGTRVCDGD